MTANTDTRPVVLQATSRAPRATVHPRAVLAIVLVSYFMIVLDNSIIFTGLPQIQKTMQL